jgi:hypothetical protein
METIQSIRGLKKELGVIRLPATVLKSVETIKTTLQSQSDQHNGWRKVEWRGGASASASASASAHSRNHSSAPSHSHSRGGGRFDMGNRASGSSGSSGSYSRPRTSFPSRDPPPPSIPLTYAPPSSSVATSEVDHGFEVVRRHPRRMKPESGSGSGNGNSSSGGMASSSPTVEFRSGPPQKYVSKFKRVTEKVEDTILNTILLGKLNKFSASNYEDIKEFITQIIDSGQTDMMKCFMKLVFEKAASEEIFCPLYAKLLSELSAQYPVLLTEMASLYAHYMSIFIEVSEEPDKTHQDFCQRNVEKKYRRGYSQFLAELTKHHVIDTEVFVQTVLKIVEQIEADLMNPNAVKRVEELADCLVRMLKAIPPTEMASQEVSTITRIRSMLKEDVAMRIQPLTVRRPDAVGLSNKARFTFMDIYEGVQKY